MAVKPEITEAFLDTVLEKPAHWGIDMAENHGIDTAIQLSIALSLKRIADILEKLPDAIISAAEGP